MQAFKRATVLRHGADHRCAGKGNLKPKEDVSDVLDLPARRRRMKIYFAVDPEEIAFPYTPKADTKRFN